MVKHSPRAMESCDISRKALTECQPSCRMQLRRAVGESNSEIVSLDIESENYLTQSGTSECSVSS